jgi:hypothetical protein
VRTTDQWARAVSDHGRKVGRSVGPSARGIGDRQMGPRGRARLREAVPGDTDCTIEIGRPRSSTMGLTAVGGAALAHGGEVAGAGVGAG